MMKNFLCLAMIVVAAVFVGCKDYDSEISDINSRLDGIEKTQIATLQKQYEAIRKSIPQLEGADKELKEYIATLQATVTNLQNELTATNSKIDEIKATLQGDISSVESDLLEQLTSLQNDLQGEINFINNTLLTLQDRDAALEQQIEDLNKRIEDLANANVSAEWVNETFVTLEHYNNLSSDVVVVKTQIEAMTINIAQLETRLNNKITNGIAEAVASLSDNIQQKVAEITAAYTDAILIAKDDITEAYTDAIRNAISDLETSFKSWVNEQFDGYCTIAEAEAKLTVLQSFVTEKDEALQLEIDTLAKTITNSRAEITKAYIKAIEEAIAQNNGTINNKIATEIAYVNSRIDEEVASIYTRISILEQRLGLVEGKIASIEEQIANINSSIEMLKETDTNLNEYIESLQVTAADLQDSIEDTNAKIKALEETLQAEGSTANAAVLAQLSALKAEMEDEFNNLSATITELQAKDAELEKNISDLQTYIETELNGTKDWATATFATLEQCNTLSVEIATVKAQIATINSSIEALESRVREKIAADIAAAVSALNSEIQQEVKGVTDAYIAAIASAKEEITSAYTAVIADAISGLETSVQSWVSIQLRGYYTIAEIEGKLAALQSVIGEGDANLQSQIDILANALAQLKTNTEQEFAKAIEDAINNNNGYIDTKISTAILDVNTHIDNEIASVNAQIIKIENRLNKIEQDIASINEQITDINTSIDALKGADAELNEYVGKLETTAENLQKAIDAINAKIKALEDSLQEEGTTANAAVLAELAALKLEMENEFAQIAKTIATLQAKDSELENKISILETYANNELRNTEDWVNATFATLEQYNALADEVATVKAQIAAINSSIEALETRVNEKITNDIAAAVATLNIDLRQKVEEITSACTVAIGAAKEEITSAYTDAIAGAISALEISMQSWVSEKLKGYYTIAEVDAQLATLAQEFNDKLDSQKAYLEGLINALSEELKQLITVNASAIVELKTKVSDLENLASVEQANKIAENAATIAANAQNISANAQVISANSSNITENASKIEECNAQIAANTKLIADNAIAIKALKESTNANNATLNASVLKNATDITANAENIAKNAALIVQNATAINNNARAIAQNSADILQLQQDLAKSKSEITEAYKKVINEAITTLDGELRDAIAEEINKINNDATADIAAVRSAIETITNRVAVLESEVDAIQQQIASILQDIADMKQNIENLMKRIQSVSYIPTYSDGKATVEYVGTTESSEVTLDFKVSPKECTAELARVWGNTVKVEAVYTKTRAVSFVDLPILSCEADDTNGVITIIASGENLSEEFYTGNQSANVALNISDGNNSVVSEHVEILGWISSNIYIRDANFKAYLIEKFDKNADNEISKGEALDITIIDVESYYTPITSLSGIEYMTNLEQLNCSDNRITSLDLSNNIKLQSLEASDNIIERILVSPSIKGINIRNNKIKAVDFASCTQLETADISNNCLSGDLDISNCRQLTTVYLFDNQLENIFVWDECTNVNSAISYDYESVSVKYKNGNKVSKFFIGQYIPINNGGIVVTVENNGENAKIISVDEASKLSWKEADSWCKIYGEDWYLPSLNEWEFVTDVDIYTSIDRALTYGGYKLLTPAPFDISGSTLFDDYGYWSSDEYPWGTQRYSLFFYESEGFYKKIHSMSGTSGLFNVRAFLAL